MGAAAAAETGCARPRSAGRAVHAVMIAVIVLSNVFGNFLMSRGLKGHQPPAGLGYIRVLFTPEVGAGVLLLILWMISRMVFLRWADLTYVIPVTAVGYVLNALLSRFFLGEQISATRWAGTLLIMAGAALAGSTAARTRTGGAG